jgi:inner membrane protein
MRQEGHLGLSLLLSAPFTLGIALLGYVEASFLFTAVVVWFASFPDVDIKLQKWTGKNGITGLKDLITIKHRGITHTVGFAIGCGTVLSSFGFLILHFILVLSLFDTLLYTIILFFGAFLGVLYHVAGDIVTVTGVNFMPSRRDKNYALDWFNFNNYYGNFGAVILGFTAILLAILTGVSGVIDIWDILLFISIYVVFVPLWIELSKRSNKKENGTTSEFAKYTNIRYLIRQLLKL